MALNTHKLNNWIRNHKGFALALPIAILLLLYFLSTSFNGLRGTFQEEGTTDGYNDSLPDRSNGLEIKDPNTYYKESIKDSLERSRKKNGVATLVDREKENDSLEKILNDLENFSLVDGKTMSKPETEPLGNTVTDNTDDQGTKGLSETEKRIEYRKMLLRARQERKAVSQDFSAPNESVSQQGALLANIRAKASVYRDQFVVPGSRVTLILREELRVADRIFPKNTFVYATVNIQGSRLLMDIANIGNFPISLRAYDQEDGGLGIYNERAGKLLMEFYTDVEEGAVENLSRELSDGMDLPMTENAIRAFGKFFSSKKRKDRDEILLINGYKVFLKT
ncbi:MAG: conjugative transposon protein TraM [Allomuricauda sp.]